MENGHGDEGEWVALGEFARRMGVTRAAVYGRASRGTLTTRPRGNRGLEVLWQPAQRHPNGHGNGKGDDHGNGKGDVTHDVTAAVLLGCLDRAENELAVASARVTELRIQLATAHSERDAARAVAIADVATAQADTAARDAVIAELREQVAWLRLPWWRRLVRSS